MLFKLTPALQTAGIDDKLVKELVAFKASGRRDDPERQQGLHGPYEELTRIRTGRLPADYYDAESSEPWGLLVQESRSNLLWQSLSGMMDRQPDFAASYMALALDKTVAPSDYAKELSTLHRDWGKFLDHAGLVRGHSHHSMRSAYQSVACPACSMLTAMACRDPGMNQLFRDLLPLKPAERRRCLEERGLAPLLNAMIPDAPKGFTPR